MKICLYFQVHQPLRLLEYSFFQIGKNHFYENAELNERILNKVSDNCYLKANAILLKLIKKYPNDFHVNFSISGLALEQFKIYRPDVLKSFQELVKTGNVELLGETYYHSLSFNFNQQEFDDQVSKHEHFLMDHFQVKPTVFRNTELIYSNDLAIHMASKGYRGIVSEGVERILKGRSPHHVYKVPTTDGIKCIVRDHLPSDDLAFRYSDKNWKEYPLNAKKFVARLEKSSNQDAVINICMDYETFGEHHHEETGIFKVLEKFPQELLDHQLGTFHKLTDIVDSSTPTETYDVKEFISWADSERDLSAWLSNSMQYEALNKVYAMRNEVLSTENEDLIQTWKKLLTSDHFYYMCTKYWSDGDVHKYFSPYHSPYDAYIFYMNILSDFEITLKKAFKFKK